MPDDADSPTRKDLEFEEAVQSDRKMPRQRVLGNGFGSRNAALVAAVLDFQCPECNKGGKTLSQLGVLAGGKIVCLDCRPDAEPVLGDAEIQELDDGLNKAIDAEEEEEESAGSSGEGESHNTGSEQADV